ncbi:MAG TPA: hypothetical protein DCR97_14205 [Deltaproteobacteria bacterium]|nr:hypothetical protein [Deltaproteobacteria bacterium]
MRGSPAGRAESPTLVVPVIYKIMYEKRTYRAISQSDGLICYEVVCKETDLFCCTTTDLRALIEERVLFYRSLLERYISVRPEFEQSLVPIETDSFAPPVVKAMIEASTTIGVGPMACVAGAVAEFVGRDIEEYSEEYILENGGDISLRTSRERTVVIHANKSPYSGKIGIRLSPRKEPYGVCTSSGTVGPSLSFGKADAVCVVGVSALFADGLATLVANMVKKADDIAVALAAAKDFQGIKGLVAIMGDKLGVWGDLDLVKVG